MEPFRQMRHDASAPRKLALRHAIARIACDVLQDLRAASGMTRVADGSFCFDAAARANLLDYNPRDSVIPSGQSQARVATYVQGPW